MGLVGLSHKAMEWDSTLVLGHEQFVRGSSERVGTRPPGLRPFVEAMAYPQYRPPDPDGRPSIEIDFNLGGDLPEVDLGIIGASMLSIEKQQLELNEGLQVVLFEDDGFEWMLVDAIADRFNPQGGYGYGGSWVVRIDWSTFAPCQSQAKNEVPDHRGGLVAMPMLHAEVSDSSRND